MAPIGFGRHHRTATSSQGPPDCAAISSQGRRRPTSQAQSVTDAGLRHGLLVPSLVALAAFLVLIGLGTWQLERKVWKEKLIAAMDERLAAAPVALPRAFEWRRLNPDNSEFRRVKFHAQFAEGRGVWV